jgi:DNA invertase Pin-like site-specific DNA recombinase
MATMSLETLDRGKIRPEHRARAAYVYVRQSSLKQVRAHQESRRRQYAFAEQARALGWSEAQVLTLDDDQGRSGTLPGTRGGFGDLVTAVARAEPGALPPLAQ